MVARHVGPLPARRYGPSMISSRTRSEPLVADLVVSVWEGSGPPVLGLAGLGSSGRTFGPLAEDLGDRHVVSPHLRGRGGSTAARGRAGWPATPATSPGC